MRNSKLVATLAAIPLLLSPLVANATESAQSDATADLQQMREFLAEQFPGYGAQFEALGAPSAFGDSGVSPNHDGGSLLNPTLLDRAEPDECFAGIGNPYPTLDANCTYENLEDNGQPKINESYVWGMAQSSRAIWFGTGANVNCLVSGTFLGSTNPNVDEGDNVCEFGQSQRSQHASVPAALGDYRTPHIYRFDLRTQQNLDLSSRVTGAEHQLRLARTIGLRAAGVYRDSVVYLAGPGFGGINIFAFSAQNASFLGSMTLNQYSNIRSFVSDGRNLYAGVAVNNVEPNDLSDQPPVGGQVLKFVPKRNNPFNFTVVGNIPGGEAAELALHDGRLFVGTWPNPGTGSPEPAAIWASPRMERRELTSWHANSWQKQWDVTEYEADPVIARTYGIGAMKSFDGELIWGTMHVPFVSLAAKWAAYSPSLYPDDGSQEERLLLDALATYRVTSIFAADDFDYDFGAKALHEQEQEVELLYGQPVFPVWVPVGEGTDPDSPDYPGTWTLQLGQMGMPTLGLSGFGNPFNNYTWSMAEYDGELFIGTMDWSYLLLGDITLPDPDPEPASNGSGPTLSAADFGFELPNWSFGADLWKLRSTDRRASAVSENGMGNTMNYGFRTMVSNSRGLYVGTANPMNLSQDGGWELYQLRKQSKRSYR